MVKLFSGVQYSLYSLSMISSIIFNSSMLLPVIKKNLQLDLFSTLLIKLLNIEAGTLLVLPEPPIPSIILVIL